MDTAFGLQEPEGVAATHYKLGRTDTGLGAFRDGLDLEGEAPPVGPPGVHTKQGLSPVLRIGAARSGLHLADRVTLVVLTAEQRPQLEFFKAAGQRCHRHRDLSLQAVVSLLDGHLDQRLGFLDVAGQAGVEVEILDDRGQVLLDASTTVLVVPQVWICHLGLQVDPTFCLLGDPEVAGGLVETDPQRGQVGSEVLHVRPRDTACTFALSRMGTGRYGACSPTRC